MTWELCAGSSEYLVDLWGGQDNSVSWQKAKQHFKEKGYKGRFLLIKRSIMTGAFAVWQINIE